MLPGMAPESLFKQKLPNYAIGLRFRVSGLGVLELGAFREFGESADGFRLVSFLGGTSKGGSQGRGGCYAAA